MISIHLGDCIEWLVQYAARIEAGQAEPFDSCATDPPYHLASIVKRFGKQGSAAVKVPEGGTGAYARASKGFMGKEWDGGDVAFRPETWRAVYDCLKPGAHLVAFGGTRTYHRMACAIEDAGFEIRDMLQWHYGSGFPKSHNTARAIRAIWPEPRNQTRAEWQAERRAIRLVARAYEGHGTGLKPATEPICLARKPLSEKSVAANVLRWGTGALNIDGCRIEGEGTERTGRAEMGYHGGNLAAEYATGSSLGRWPANIAHDGSEDVLGAFPQSKDGIATNRNRGKAKPAAICFTVGHSGQDEGYGGEGSAARFFYSAKAGPLDRLGSKHATVKPVDLMRWLCRMITPPDGHILEPFAGSGTTGIAAMAEGFGCTMIEMDPDHVADIERKLAFLRGEGRLRIEEHKRQEKPAADEMGALPLFSANWGDDDG